jgi:hypothetical protein
MVAGTVESVRDGAPDPRTATDLSEFIALLGHLRIWAGWPSYRDLARRVGPLLRPARTVSPATVVDVFKVARRRLDLDLVVGIVRALGLGEGDVAQWRDVCVRMHAQAKSGASAGVLRQLPADLATFTGRQAELEFLLATVRRHDQAEIATAAICAIEGMAGVGKTRLSVHLAHRLVRSGRYSDAQLYADLRGFGSDQPPATAGAVLEAFLRALRVPAQLIPESVAERSAMFRDRIHDKRVLVVLDNAADEKQVRDLIPAAPGCLVLITSRRTMAGLEGATTLRLDVLEPAASQVLLGRIAGSERTLAEPAATAAVVATCGHLPLAVSLAAARLRSRPTWSVTDLLTELRGDGLQAMAVGGRSVAETFDAWLDGFDVEQHRMFLFLGVCPGEDIGAEAAAIMAGTTPTSAKALMDSLVDEHLVLAPAPGRFALHRVLRGYAAGKAADRIPAPQRWASLRRVLSWYAARMHDADAYRPPRARKLLAQAPALADGSGLSDAWRAIGHAHLWSEEFEAAENAYRRALRLAPVGGDRIDALFSIRQARREQGLTRPAHDVSS